MNRESAWGLDRWRSSTATPFGPPIAMSPLPYSHQTPPVHYQHQHQPSHPQHQPSRPLPHQALHSTSHKITPDGGNNTPRIPHNLPRLTEPFAVGPHHSDLSDRRQTPTPNIPREVYAGSWRSLQDDRCTSSTHGNTDAPQLTLHIPPQQASDLPRISNVPSSQQKQDPAGPNDRIKTPATSLPSFATLEEGTNRSNDEVDGPEIASMSSRLSCTLCPKLKPLVHEIAVAVGELDDSVQAYCNKPVSKATDIPKDGPLNVAQWILDRLPLTRANLQAFGRQPQAVQQFPSNHAVDSSAQSPPNPLKRSGEQWEREDPLALKRPRSGVSIETPFQLPAYTPREDHRASVDFAYGREHHPGYSPPPPESIPGSAFPKHASPTLNNRHNPRGLPSPSSYAYPPSAAPSLPPPTVASVGSPATSYQQTASIHTASTNSVTSAHMADLQHQVTLKSLALQTLQSEYASLLQKLQRERVKSQTIEKKTCVADQEVNDLTNKNEDLAERVKELEVQLEETEKRRDVERANAARDKEQWGRMLSMSDRLQAKVESERQRLMGEKEVLQKRLASLEGHEGGETLQLKEHAVAPEPNKSQPSTIFTPNLIVSGSATATPGDPGQTELAGLRQEVESLNERLTTLRSTLEEARLHNQDLESRTRVFLEQNTQWAMNIDRVLTEDNSKANKLRKERSTSKVASSCSSPSRLKAARDTQSGQHSVTRQVSVEPTLFRASPQKPPPGTFEYISNGKRATAVIAEVARAKSPGPEELGIHIAPTTSSPEELIQALGPVSTQLPSLQFIGHQHPWYPPTAPDMSKDANHVHHMSSWRGSAPPSANRPAGTSPRSYHSSPGAAIEDNNSSSGASDRSEAYTSEPEARKASRYMHSPPHARYGPWPAAAPRSEGHENWMPPPPRPTESLHRTTHV